MFPMQNNPDMWTEGKKNPTNQNPGPPVTCRATGNKELSSVCPPARANTFLKAMPSTLGNLSVFPLWWWWVSAVSWKLVVLKYTLGLGKECQGLVGGHEWWKWCTLQEEFSISELGSLESHWKLVSTNWSFPPLYRLCIPFLALACRISGLSTCYPVGCACFVTWNASHPWHCKSICVHIAFYWDVLVMASVYLTCEEGKGCHHHVMGCWSLGYFKLKVARKASSPFPIKHFAM